MRKALLLFAVLGLAGSLWAVDPIIGKWKLNIDQSKLLHPPKECTESYREIDGKRIEMTSVWIGSDGSSDTEKFTFPSQGGISKFSTAINKGRQVIESRIAPGEWYAVDMQDGKQTMTIHKAISKDGKTMRHTVGHTDSKGNITEELLILDRQ